MTGKEKQNEGISENGGGPGAGGGKTAHGPGQEQGVPDIIEVRNLVKKFNGLTAVNDVNFAIGKGVCFGLLGPNGAGKTTTIEMIEDIISPTAGQILYRGRKRSGRFREEIGIQFQNTELLSFMTVAETLETFRNFYSDALDPADLLDLCQLTEVKDSYTDRMSGGQKQRLYLALALINEPSLLFLDEPSTGLDPQARKHLWDIVQKVKAEGKTIVLTTHYMEEAEFLCDTIAIMDHGRIIAQGSPDELIRKYCKGVTIILPEKNFTLCEENFALAYRRRGDYIEIDGSDINSGVRELLAAGADLADMTVRTPNLETVFLSLTGRSLRD